MSDLRTKPGLTNDNQGKMATLEKPVTRLLFLQSILNGEKAIILGLWILHCQVNKNVQVEKKDECF